MQPGACREGTQSCSWAVLDRIEPLPLDSLIRRHHDVSRQAIWPADSGLLRHVRLTVWFDRRRRERPLRRLGAGSITPDWKGALREGAGGARTRLSLGAVALPAETNPAKGRSRLGVAAYELGRST